MSARDEAIERALMEAWCNRPDVGISDVRAFDAALTAAGLVVEQGWQPIKTAPKDQMVLVYAPSPDPTRWHTSVCDLSPIICAAKWHPEGGWCVCEIREVTHWRPLPAAPQEDQR